MQTATGNVSLFEASTHYKNWRYSQHQLAAIRSSLNASAVTAIRNTFESDQPGSSSNVRFLNAQEELLLVKYFLSKLVEICGLFRFPEEVEATAVTYLKRFYLKNTVMDWHPKNVMLTALFLATKTTNNPISLDSFTARLKQSPSDVLDLEFLVAQSLAFEFAIWHAHRALWGIWLDIQTLPDVPSQDEMRRCYDDAMSQLRMSRYTDAELIFTPAQIALACISLSRPDLAEVWAKEKQATTILPTIQVIKDVIIRNGNAPEKSIVTEIDRRLKLCKNPEKIEGTKAYEAKKAREEAEAEAKRLKKVQEIQRAVEEGDPFGDDLPDRAKEIAQLDDDD